MMEKEEQHGYQPKLRMHHNNRYFEIFLSSANADFFFNHFFIKVTLIL